MVTGMAKNIKNNLPDNLNPGFIPANIEYDHWVLGSAASIKSPELTDGHWYKLGHVPDGERQGNPFMDSNNCTGFGYTNRVEILWHRVFGAWRNFSDRWVGIISGTEPPGNNQHTVAEAAREYGLVDEIDLPFNDSIDEVGKFYAPKPLTRALLAKGEQFLREHTIRHDWVESNPAAFKYALRFSPIGIAVTAWYKGDDGLYYFPEGMGHNHDTTLVDYEEGKYWLIFDSYPDDDGSYLKKIRWDSIFQLRSKRYAIEAGCDKIQGGLFGMVKKLFGW